MSGLLQDLRQAVCQFRLSPGFAALAVITLALAIGASTAMFTVAEDVPPRPLPYTDASRLALINPSTEARQQATSWLNYRDVRDQATHSFSQIGIYSEDVGVVEGNAQHPRPRRRLIGIRFRAMSHPPRSPHPTSARISSPCGVPPLLGRTFTPQEGEENGPKVVVLSERLRARRFTPIQPSLAKPSV